MVTVAVEALERRTLFSGPGTDAAVVEDRIIIRGDIQKLHFDWLQLRQTTKIDSENARVITTGDRNRVRDDLVQLKGDDRNNPANVNLDLSLLRSDETNLTTDLRNLTDTARADRTAVVAEILTDRATLKADRQQLQIDLKS